MTEAWAVEVSTVSVEVHKPERGNSYCIFKFSFRIGAAKHRFEERYRNIHNFHKKLSTTVKNLPHFPPKSWLFQSTTDQKFQEKRKNEFMVYFQKLVLEPFILKHDLFHELLNLPDNLKTTMIKIAQDMESKKYVVDLHLKDYNSSHNSDCKASSMRELTDSLLPDHRHEMSAQKLREIHNEFKDSILDDVLDGDELHNDVEELMQHPKIQKYKE